MPNADLEQFQNRRLDRATITTRGQFVDMSIDVGAYRLGAKFNKDAPRGVVATVTPRPAHSPQRVSMPDADESDHEQPASQWEAAGTFLGKMDSFGRAVWSKWKEGPVIGAKLDFRVQCCFGETMAGERVNDPCPSMVVKGGDNYCRSCGCGKRVKARLNPQRAGDWTTSKLAYPRLICPMKRFGVVAGSRVEEGVLAHA